MNKKVIIAIVVTLLVAGGAALAINSSNKDEPTPAVTQEATNTPDTGENLSGNSQTDATAETATITYSDSGFSPATITVASGTTVTIKNTSSSNIQFNSDPHPQHTDNEELNVDGVAPGKSRTFVVTTKGTFGYHNHLNPSETGTIIVN